MKSLKTKVIMSAFVLLFALVATIGSTYAWFTISSTVNVSAMNIDVVTEDSLLIRVWDGETEVNDQGYATYGWGLDDFSNTITNALLIASTQYTNILSAYLKPMTAASNAATSNATDYQDLDLDALSYITLGDANRALTSAMTDKNNTTTGGYIEIKFWVMAVNNESIANIAVRDLVVENETLAALPNALRFGVKGDAGQTGDTETDSIFALGPDYAFTFTDTDAGYIPSSSYNSIPNSDPLYQDLLVADHSLFYDSTASSDTTNISTGDGTGSGIAGAKTICTLEDGIPEILTVRIWLEGWDAQTDNLLMGESFDISFKFEIK